MRFRRVFLLILDSAGIGELPDAVEFGDVGSNTIGNTAKAIGGLKLPILESFGLGNIAEIKGVLPALRKGAYYGKMAELSKGKDTTVGHWEMMGVITEQPFPTFPAGFPEEILLEIRERTGVEFIGNYPASGTEIINKLGEEHIKTKKPILYTSADSVFQIAAHIEIMPLEKLYALCQSVREILNKYRVARVIARPFRGESGNFQRTPDRRDYSIPPPEKSILEYLVENNIFVFGVGKVGEIFAFRGFTEVIHTGDNTETQRAVSGLVRDVKEGLVFANFVDFDMLYGHRNNPEGYARALEKFDRWLGETIPFINENDLLIITADHGNDPTTPSTDHSREYVPIMIFSPSLMFSGNLGTRGSFADVGQTLSENFLGKNILRCGNSFLSELK